MLIILDRENMIDQMNLFQKECEEIRQQIAKIFFQIIFKYNKYKINGPKKPKTAIQKKPNPLEKKPYVPPSPSAVLKSFGGSGRRIGTAVPGWGWRLIRRVVRTRQLGKMYLYNIMYRSAGNRTRSLATDVEEGRHTARSSG